MSDNEFSYRLWWDATECSSCKIQFQVDPNEFEVIIVTTTDYITLSIGCLSNKILLHNCDKCIIEKSDGTSIGEYEVEHKVVGRYDIGKKTLLVL